MIGVVITYAIVMFQFVMGGGKSQISSDNSGSVEYTTNSSYNNNCTC